MELADVVWTMFLGLVVSQFSLDCVGTQEGVRDKRARETTRQDVIPQLQAQIVPKDRGRREAGDASLQELSVTLIGTYLEELSTGTSLSPLRAG